MNRMPKKKLNNQGFSLVELLVAIALMAIVGLAISGFLTTINQNYKRNQTEVDIQYESQTVMNQIKDLMIDATMGITVDDTIPGDDIAIYIYNDTSYYRLMWKKGEHSIFLETFPKTDDAPADVGSSAALVSDYVYDFLVDYSTAESRKVYTLSFSFAQSDTTTHKYNSSVSVMIRNQIEYQKTRVEIYP